MTPRPALTCAHDLRPGTTVCLYCRAEERAAARVRRRRATLRAMTGAGAVASVAALLAIGVTALRGGSPDAVAASTAASADTATRTAPLPVVALAGEAEAAAAAESEPIVPPGRTSLADGIFAERQGNVVTVNFDTQGARTRRSDKFESVVRSTLPAVLGAAGQAALDRVQAGGLVPPGGLLTAAQQGALRLPVGDGRLVRLTPRTRMGQDGPLVVTYSVTIERNAGSPAS